MPGLPNAEGCGLLGGSGRDHRLRGTAGRPAGLLASPMPSQRTGLVLRLPHRGQHPIQTRTCAPACTAVLLLQSSRLLCALLLRLAAVLESHSQLSVRAARKPQQKHSRLDRTPPDLTPAVHHPQAGWGRPTNERTISAAAQRVSRPAPSTAQASAQALIRTDAARCVRWLAPPRSEGKRKQLCSAAAAFSHAQDYDGAILKAAAAVLSGRLAVHTCCVQGTWRPWPWRTRPSPHLPAQYGI